MSSRSTALALRTEFPAEVRERILSELGEGKPLRAICKAPGMPSRRTVTRWANRDKAFAEAVRAARADGAEELVWSGLEDLEAVDPDAKNGSARVQLAREKATHKRWMASKMDAASWGDKLHHQVSTEEVTRIALFAGLRGPRAKPAGAEEETKT